MPQKLLAVTALVLFPLACRDGPVAVETAPPRVQATPPDALTLVAQLMDSAFMRPLIERALGPAAADQLATALEPLGTAPSRDQLGTAAVVLAGVQAGLRRMPEGPDPPGGQNGPLFASEVATDAEALIIQDVLMLVVADALQTVLAAGADSSGVAPQP